MQNNTIDLKQKNRRKLMLILLIFALPVIVSMLMYFGGWRPTATGNHGELIQPARLIADENLQSIDGKQVKLSDLHGKWTMFYFNTASCPAECVNRLFFMRQIHHSQGKYLDKIQRVFILTDENSISTLKSKLVEYPDMQVLTADKTVLAKLSKDFEMDTQDHINENNIYLVDPLGNWMMRYKSDVEPAGMRKDFERLLKYTTEAE